MCDLSVKSRVLIGVRCMVLIFPMYNSWHRFLMVLVSDGEGQRRWRSANLASERCIGAIIIPSQI
jgi:hypothetical protein